MHKNLNFVNPSRIRLHITKVTKLNPTTFMLGALTGNHKQLDGERFTIGHGVRCPPPHTHLVCSHPAGEVANHPCTSHPTVGGGMKKGEAWVHAFL